MRVFVIGGKGFVGSAYVRLLTHLGIDHVIITRENYGEHIGQSCDVLINANGNSSKLMADRDPKEEFDASVRSVVRSLDDFTAATYVLLSSGDVYPRLDFPELTREELVLDTHRMSRYGLHKYVAETMVRSIHGSWVVVRMGGFIGPGLKKNAIFDMLHDRPIWLDPGSELQFISTDRAAELVWKMLRRGVVCETVNLGAEGVIRIGDLYERLKPKSGFQPGARRVRFEISTLKLQQLVGGALPRSIEEVENFLAIQGR